MCNIDEYKRDYDLSFFRIVSTFIIINALNIVISYTVSAALILNNKTIILGIVFAIVLFIERKYFYKVLFRCIILEAVFIILMLISFAAHPTLRNQIFERMIWTFTFCIPLFSMSLDVENQAGLLENIEMASFFSFICGVFIFIECFVLDNNTYSMSLGYLLLPSAIFFSKKMFENTFFLFLFLFDFIVILLCASRGPLLCITIYLIWELLSKSNSSLKGKTKIIILVLLIGIFIFYDRIMELLSLVSRETKIDSRTLMLIQEDMITRDSGRKDLFFFNLQKIREKPVFGWGLCGELEYMNVYPHNLFIELWVDYGLVFGTLLGGLFAFSVLWKLITSFFSNDGIIGLLCIGFIPLLFSSTYLNYPFFWILIGFCLPFRIVVW